MALIRVKLAFIRVKMTFRDVPDLDRREVRDALLGLEAQAGFPVERNGQLLTRYQPVAVAVEYRELDWGHHRPKRCVEGGLPLQQR